MNTRGYFDCWRLSTGSVITVLLGILTGDDADYYSFIRRKVMNISENEAFILPDSGSSFHELCDWYFKVYAPLELKLRTIENNRKLLRCYAFPFIGDIPLSAITPCHIDYMMSQLLKRPGKPLAAGSVNLVRAAVSGVFSVAVKKGIADKNPVSGTSPVRRFREQKRFLDKESSRVILSRLSDIRNPQVARAIKVLLYTGLRRGELLGLSWEDVNFEESVLIVRHTLWKNELTAPKTMSSVRTVPLSHEVTECLKEQFIYIHEKRSETGDAWTETGMVFTNRHGGYMNGEYLNNTFRKFLNDNGLPGMHIHDLRHANASILINSGVPMKVVSEHLGHSSVKTTEDFYTHLFASSKKITAEVLSEALAE